MKLRLFTSLFLVTGILAFSGFVHAGSTVIQVTDNFYSDSLPQIKGDYVVWQGKVNDNWEVFACNIYTPEAPIRITDNNYDDISPQTDGNYVVWLGHSSAGGEVFLYNIASGTTTQITDNDNVDSPPQIADGRVAWSSQEVADSVEPGEIILYHIVGGVTEQLTNDVLNDSDPRINGEAVLWVQTDGEDNSIPFIHDIATGVTTEAPEDFVWGESPQTDGNLTVLTRHDGDDREIFLLNSDSRKYHQVTDNDVEDSYPSISGNNMAWMAAGEIFLGEYEYLGLSRPADNALLSNNPPATFAWEGISYEKYKVEFSSLALPPGNDSFLLQASFTPTEEDWKTIRAIGEKNGSVLWRVEGVRSDGSVGYSETWSFTIKEFEDVATGITNEDTGDSGSGGPCFISTAAFDQ
jgi:hypothetical protein